MIVDYWILTFALLLLWFPRKWLSLGRKGSQRSSRDNASPRQFDAGQDERSNALRIRILFSNPRNWFDLARAAAGAFAVNYGCFSVEPEAVKNIALKIFALKGILLVIAVLVQSIRLELRLRLVAPIFFILGLSFGLIGWQSALFAFVTVWTCNRAMPNAGVFLFTSASFQIAFGMLFARGLLTYQLLSAALAFLPVLLSGVFNRPLVRLNKSSRRRRR